MRISGAHESRKLSHRVAQVRGSDQILPGLSKGLVQRMGAGHRALSLPNKKPIWEHLEQQGGSSDHKKWEEPFVFGGCLSEKYTAFTFFALSTSQ